MTSGNSEVLLEAAAALANALRKTGLPHMLIGGLAVIARGAVRLTKDVDLDIVMDQTVFVRGCQAALGPNPRADIKPPEH